MDAYDEEAYAACLRAAVVDVVDRFVRLPTGDSPRC